MFVVEHVFNLGLYLADNVLLFYSGTVSRPLPDQYGFNQFLGNLNIIMRRDHDTLRPRINKLGSQNDTDQKRFGNSMDDVTHHSKWLISHGKFHQRNIILTIFSVTLSITYHLLPAVATPSTQVHFFP